ncbi:MAG: hypothetical protein AB6733_03020 [Clostridiaceae bacterium]
MEEVIDDKKRFEMEMILANYTCMFNAKDLSPFAYKEIQKINPKFPHIDDGDFWGKLNAVFLESYSMDLANLEKYLTEGIEGEPFRRTRIFELIRQKKVQ